MKSRKFNIGECAIGGRINISITAKAVAVQVLDWDTNKVIQDKTFSNNNEVYWLMHDYFNEITTSYYCEKMLEFVIANSNVEYQMFRQY